MTINAFPLTWPHTFPRARFREHGKFKTALPAAIKNVQTSLKLFASDSGKKLGNLTISSNVTLGVDAPADPGVAVWFVWDSLQVCIAVDRYYSVASNLQAIHYIIEARRVELRHGTLALVRATFQGFLSLPAPPGREWWDVLECERNASPEFIKAQFRRLASEHHPDRGGSADKMAELNAAQEKALQERAG